jgi:ArsR family transcriptional regulator
MSELSSLFKALSADVRLQILALLQRHGELCVCEVESVLGLSQSTASRHLRSLARSGWVESRREGKWVYYGLAEPQTDEHRLLRNALPELLRGVNTPTVEAELAALLLARCDGPADEGPVGYRRAAASLTETGAES